MKSLIKSRHIFSFCLTLKKKREEELHRFSVEPKFPIQQNAVIRFFNFVELFSCSFPFHFFTFDTKTFFTWINTSKDLIPNFEIKSGVKRLIFDRNGVMKIMLKRCVDNRMMSVRIRKFVTPMKINSVTIEKCCELNEKNH